MDSPTPFFSDQDWRISDKQRSMISDRIRGLSKREASLLITFIESCIYGRRISEVEKNEQS